MSAEPVERTVVIRSDLPPELTRWVQMVLACHNVSEVRSLDPQLSGRVLERVRAEALRREREAG